MKIVLKEKEFEALENLVGGTYVSEESEESGESDESTPEPILLNESYQRRCFRGSWLTWLFIVTVMTISQVCVYYFFFHGRKSAPVLSPVQEFNFIDNHGKLRHVHFAWRNCGGKSDPFKLKKLEVSPDPVNINGNITLTMDANLEQSLDAPISASVRIKTTLFGEWVTIPCVGGKVGSCDYEDICALNPFPPSQPCPDPFPRFGLPCRCPFPKGPYKVTDGVFTIPEAILDYVPEWLVAGNYHVVARTRKGKKPISCLGVYFSLTD